RIDDVCNSGQWTPTNTCHDPDSCTDDATQSRRRYQSAAVPVGEECVTEDQARSCVVGSWSSWSGSFLALECSELPPACGNDRVEVGESCDDGNAVSGDGCASDCAAIEP